MVLEKLCRLLSKYFSHVPLKMVISHLQYLQNMTEILGRVVVVFLLLAQKKGEGNYVSTQPA